MNYLVSTIQYNALVNKNLLRNMLNFATKHDVETIYLYVMPGRNKDETLLPTFEDERIELLYLGKEGKKLNSNLKLFDTQILASQINPLTGFNKKLHRDFSYILPSPKIRYQSIANTSKYPRFLATTGALSQPNYRENTAQGRKAVVEHQYGFSFVRVKNGRLFDFYPVEAMRNGNFHFMREYYKSGKVYDDQPEAMVLGDIHVGETCPKVWAKTLTMIDELRPKRVVLHDLFDGSSVNHHERYNNVARAKLWSNNFHIMENEVRECHAFLVKLAEAYPEIEMLVVESNHDIRLSKYIGQENFLMDGQNSVFACKLFIEMNGGNSQPVLKTAMELVGNIPINVTFLGENDEYRVRGVGLHVHGHRGCSGARGTPNGFSNNNLRLITGHTHQPCLLANHMTVGTSTKLDLDYLAGPSAWLNSHGLLYSSGKMTLLTIVI